MFGIMTFMFVLGIIILALETALKFQGMQLLLGLTAGIKRSSYRVHVIDAVASTFIRLMVRLHHTLIPSAQLTAVQYILSDIVCAWRAVVLWNRDKRVVAILLLFILGTIGT